MTVLAPLAADARDRTIVWVLGAGFSAHLGGPLFRTLLTPECRDRFPEVFGDGRNGASAALWLYNWGTRFNFGELYAERRAGERLWEDAEAFLDILDTTHSIGRSSPMHQKLVSLLGGGQAGGRFRSLVEKGDLSAVAIGARQLLAAECGAFLFHAETGGERWIPYKRWMEMLEPHDAVLTFNYDLVLERLDPKSQRVHVVLPGETPCKDRAAVLKLHGSIDWDRADDGKYSRNADSQFCLNGDKRIGIATPGPSKSASTRELAALWDLAQGALKRADAVVFMGYRFPPSDSEALSHLSTALAGNDKYHVSYHVVLGPARTDDMTRLERLLFFTAGNSDRVDMPRRDSPVLSPDRTYSLQVQPLYAQDFMVLFSRPAVAFPYCWPLKTIVDARL